MSVRRLVVVGGGPAGTAAALEAADRGLSVVLIEQGQRSRRVWTELALAEELAWRPLSPAPEERVGPGFAALLRRCGEQAASVGDARNRRLARAGVDRVVGRASLTGRPGEVLLESRSSREEIVTSDAVVAAVGTRPAAVLKAGFDEQAALRDRERLLSEAQPPQSAVIVGGGREGVTLAGLLASAGTAVTLIESEPSLLPRADSDVGSAVRHALEAAGVSVLCGVTVSAASVRDGAWSVVLAEGTRPALGAQRLYLAAGRAPLIEGLRLERLSGPPLTWPLSCDLHPAHPWLAFAGGVEGQGGGPELAARSGRAAVSALLGEPQRVPSHLIPRVVSGLSGCGWVGFSEREAARRGHVIVVGRARLPGRGRLPAGFVKVIADRGSDRVLGVHAAGGLSREAIAVGAIFVEHGLSRQDLRVEAFAPGSPAEMLAEAAAVATEP